MDKISDVSSKEIDEFYEDQANTLETVEFTRASERPYYISDTAPESGIFVSLGDYQELQKQLAELQRENERLKIELRTTSTVNDFKTQLLKNMGA